jgi:cytochrome b561
MSASKYDPVTRWLHAALALGVIVELGLLSVMRVPPGPGLGVRDWHREAFEIHCRVGPIVAVLCALHWTWISLPLARPGVGYLFPWWRAERRPVLLQELRNLLRLKTPASDELSPLVGSIQGLGLCAVSASVLGGTVSYLGYFMRVPVPASVLHGAALELIVTSWLVWPFVVGHALMALWHRFHPTASAATVMLARRLET